MLAQLEMRRGPAILEQREAHPGTQRDDAFQAAAGDDAEALHRRIVLHAGRRAQLLGERVGEREAVPGLGLEVGRGEHAPVAHHAGEADRYAVERAERADQVRPARRRPRRGGRMRRVDALGAGGHAAGRRQHPGLQPRAADVDRERQRSGGSILVIWSTGCSLLLAGRTRLIAKWSA